MDSGRRERAELQKGRKARLCLAPILTDLGLRRPRGRERTKLFVIFSSLFFFYFEDLVAPSQSSPHGWSLFTKFAYIKISASNLFPTLPGFRGKIGQHCRTLPDIAGILEEDPGDIAQHCRDFGGTSGQSSVSKKWIRQGSASNLFLTLPGIWRKIGRHRPTSPGIRGNIWAM